MSKKRAKSSSSRSLRPKSLQPRPPAPPPARPIVPSVVSPVVSSVDENAPTAYTLQLPGETPRHKRFRSLRWRVLTPLSAVLLVGLMLAAYGLGYALLGDESENNREALTLAGRAIADNALDLGRQQRTEVDRIAFTEGVRANVASANGAALQTLVEPLAAIGGFDLVAVGNPGGAEVIGLQRVVEGGAVDYAVTTATSLGDINAVAQVLGGAESATSLIEVERRPMLVTAGPIPDDLANPDTSDSLSGVVLVGLDVRRALAQLGRGADGELVLFAGEGQRLGTTFGSTSETALDLDSELYDAVLTDLDAATFASLSVDDTSYQVAYFPFVVGQTPLGVIGVYQAEDTGFIASYGRVMLGLVFAGVVGLFGGVAYLLLGRTVRRMEHITHTADALTGGEDVRTGMQPKDEIGEMGAALDRYAAAAQLQVRQMQSAVRQQRQHVAHLHAILESLPDGVIVQDVEGRVMTMNAAARALIGEAGAANTGVGALRHWSATVQQRLGALLAPGIYALEDSTVIQVNGRSLRVEAAAIHTPEGGTLGTLLTLRDDPSNVSAEGLPPNVDDAPIITGAYSETLAHVAQEVASVGGDDPNTSSAVTMGHLISDYRELTLLRPGELRNQAEPLNVTDLLIDVVETWRPSALAVDVALDFSLPSDEGLSVWGHAEHLMWALGNIMDNALKYMDGAGRVVLSTHHLAESGQFELILEDSGVGIAAEDLPQVFSRFYRGKPIGRNGAPLRVHGTGQGLYLTHKVIEAHGGGLGLSSTPGVGTRVTVVLPLEQDAHPASLSDAVQPPPSAWDHPAE